MGTLIHAVGHGLVADDTIMLGNLVGGEGLTENTVYYVLAAGLTADDFAVGLTSGGAAVTYTTDITDGVIVNTDTYVAVSDGVMDPPDAVTAPEQPVLVSDTSTGIVRIEVTLVDPASPKIRAIEFQITDEYSMPGTEPDGPIFTNAQTHTMQPSVTTFSVKAKPLTWYSGRVRAIDVYGNASDWTVPFYGAYANIETGAGYDAVTAIETTALDHLITEVEIGEHQITAPLLESNLVLSSTIIAGTPDDDRVELDATGIALYDGATAIRARLPVDPLLPVFVRGTIEADSLESDAASLGGATSLPAGAVMTAQASIVKPTAAPTLTATVFNVPFVMSPIPSDELDIGLAYDSGNTSWWAAYWRSLENPTDGPTLREFDTDGTVLRTSDLGFSMQNMVKGVGVSTTHIYLSVFNSMDFSLTLYKYDRTDMSLVTSAVITGDVLAGSVSYTTMFYDGTNDRIVVVTATGSGATAQARFKRYNQSLVLQDTLTDVVGTYTFNGASTELRGGVLAEGYYWLDVKKNGTTPSIECWTTAGQYVADRTFGTVAGSYKAGMGLGHDGTYFNAASVVSRGTVNTFSNWDWTTASAKYWVGYSWYDSGGTDETELGPRASITLARRSRLTIQHAARPSAATSVFVYAAPSATEPAAGAYELQASNGTDYLAVSLSAYTTADKSDETVNGFPGGTASIVQSSTAGWKLQGSGEVAVDLGDAGVTKGLLFGSAGDVNLYRSAADTLKTDDSLEVGGSVAAALLHVNNSVGAVGTDTAFAISGDGTATYSVKECTYVKIGRLVVFYLRWTLSANGSGTTVLSLPSEDTGLPNPEYNFTVVGDRSGVGANRLVMRVEKGTNSPTFSVIALLATPTTGLTGAALVSGAHYSFMGSYIAAA